MKLNLLSVFILTATLGFSQINVNVKANSKMYISPATYVYVSDNGNIKIDANGEVVMDSNIDSFANLFVDGSATVDGVAEYRTWAPNAANYRDLLSPAVTGEAFNAFATRNGANLPAGTLGGNRLFGPFNPANSSYVEWNATDTNAITAGIGYRTGRASAGGTLSFQGDIETEDVDVTISFGSTGYFRYGNLIGNPFTTYLSGQDFVAELAASGAIDTRYVSVYGYDAVQTTSTNGTDGQTWTLINNTTIADGAINPYGAGNDWLIAPGQGFFVISDNDSQDETVTFGESMRRVSRSGDGFLPTTYSSRNPTTLDAKFYVVLTDTNNSIFYHADMYFFNNTVTRDLDLAWDAGAYSVGNVGIASILPNGSSNTPFRIQALPTSDLFNVSNELVIPLHVNAVAGRPYTISISEVNLPSGANIYLHDTSNDSFTLLNNDTYTFTPPSNLSGTGRFYLRTNNSTFGVDDYDFDSLVIKSIVGKKTIKVLGTLNTDANLEVYDITGRLVNNYELNYQMGSNEYSFNVSHLSAAPYVVKLTDKEGRSKEAKLIIN